MPADHAKYCPQDFTLDKLKTSNIGNTPI